MGVSRQQLFQQLSSQQWDGFLKGVEKEGLRVDQDGFIAQTPHPEGLGSALTNPRITTDYSEALLELITPVCSNTEELLGSLADIHRFVQSHLGDELLWPASMPCRLDGDASIPIAEYGSSNIGRLKHVYRQGLAVRYGRMMQSIAGTHYNLSLPDTFWEFWQQAMGDDQKLRDFKSQQYFWLIRNFRRRSWLLMLLFGASPALDASFVKGVSHDLSPFGKDSLQGEHATSLRMGDLGYHNNAQSSLDICFNQLDTYINTLDRAIHTPWPPYEAIGTKRNGQFIQINTNILQIENEYYSAVRPKRNTEREEKPIQALSARGVEYIEVRCLDLDPFSATGISETQVDFLDLFLLDCLLSESDVISDSECRTLDCNYKEVISRGREAGLTLGFDGHRATVLEEAGSLVEQLAPLAQLLDEWEGGSKYERALTAQKAKLDDPSLLPSARVLGAMAEAGQGHLEWSRGMARQHQETLRSDLLSEQTRQVFEQMARQSVSEQQAMEDSDTLSFEDFLEHYLAS
ncbi:glutamate--cysteine ligase [Marinobacter sp.]|uniref:glutamate--cysteine ligase n=1 Tax=Marinobacter sp. TaxID=50741 RepID=UPI00384F7AF1